MVTGAHASTRAGRDATPLARTRPIRLMIVDDSVVARAVLSRMVETDGGFEIAAVAGTAEDAIEALGQIRVDTILLDLEMPGVGGLKSIPKILAAAHGARVMIVSSQAEAGAEETVAALALGAADTLPKPGTGRFNGRFSQVLLAKLHALGRADRPAGSVAQPSSGRTATAVYLPIGEGLARLGEVPIELLAIGSSTGGIHALGELFGALPRRVGVPILVTQHLPAPFMAVFARQLSTTAGREALVAEDGMKLAPDRIIIAPGDAHLTLFDDHGALAVRLMRHKVRSGCLPSVDPMFASLAAAVGAGAVGVVLTGMGRDGSEGAAALVKAGGTILAQDEASSAVWGMPRAVAEAGLASAILSPAKLARRIGACIPEALCS